MDEKENKNKQKIQNILNEIDLLKKYSKDLANASQGDKLENYINKLDKDIIKAQNKLEEMYTENNI